MEQVEEYAGGVGWGGGMSCDPPWAWPGPSTGSSIDCTDSPSWLFPVGGAAGRGGATAVR
jgi:hypothetical protein